jgi:hypothetical protein
VATRARPATQQDAPPLPAPPLAPAAEVSAISVNVTVLLSSRLLSVGQSMVSASPEAPCQPACPHVRPPAALQGRATATRACSLPAKQPQAHPLHKHTTPHSPHCTAPAASLCPLTHTHTHTHTATRTHTLTHRAVRCLAAPCPQSAGSSFDRLLGASGFQLVNASNVPITLGRWGVGSDPSVRGRFANGFLSHRALANNLSRHYTREALSEAHKVGAGAAGRGPASGGGRPLGREGGARFLKGKGRAKGAPGAVGGGSPSTRRPTNRG